MLLILVIVLSVCCVITYIVYHFQYILHLTNTKEICVVH